MLLYVLMFLPKLVDMVSLSQTSRPLHSRLGTYVVEVRDRPFKAARNLAVSHLVKHLKFKFKEFSGDVLHFTSVLTNLNLSGIR